MRDLDLPRGEERELVVDRDRVHELNGEDLERRADRGRPGRARHTRGAVRRHDPAHRISRGLPHQRQTSLPPCVVLLFGLSVKTPWQWLRGVVQGGAEAPGRLAAAFRACGNPAPGRWATERWVRPACHNTAKGQQPTIAAKPLYRLGFRLRTFRRIGRTLSQMPRTRGAYMFKRNCSVKVVSLTFTSWNQIAGWLRRLEGSESPREPW